MACSLPNLKRVGIFGVAASLVLSLVYQLGECPCGCWEGSRWAAVLDHHGHAPDEAPAGPEGAFDHAHVPAPDGAFMASKVGRGTTYAPSGTAICTERVVPAAASQTSRPSAPAAPRAPPDLSRPALGVYLL